MKKKRKEKKRKESRKKEEKKEEKQRQESKWKKMFSWVIVADELLIQKYFEFYKYTFSTLVFLLFIQSK